MLEPILEDGKCRKKEPRYFVNPVIKNKDKIKSTYEEGCLSVITVLVLTKITNNFLVIVKQKIVVVIL